MATVTGARAIPSADALRPLLDYNILLWPDNDEAGFRHMARQAAWLLEQGARPRIVDWPEAPEKGDAYDFFTTGGTVDALETLFARAPDAALLSRFSRLDGIGNRANRENRETLGFELTRLVDLLLEPEQEIEWLVQDMLPSGGLSILGAKPKVGKSTLARNLAVAVARGDAFFGRAVAKGSVVYLALEEKRSEVAKHFARMGARDEAIFVHVGSAPEEALEALSAAIAQHRASLAIVDPLLKLIRLRDANDYTEVSRSLEPVIDLARRTGCHILAAHHLGKAERTGGDAILGSTALFGAVDTALLMKRRDQTRTAETTQRYGRDLPETVVTLDQETGRTEAAGEVAALQLAQAEANILEAVGDENLEEADIRVRVGGNQTLTSKALRSLVDQKRLARTGAGKRGDPYRYASSLGQPEPRSATQDTVGSDTSRPPLCNTQEGLPLQVSPTPRPGVPASGRPLMCSSCRIRAVAQGNSYSCQPCVDEAYRLAEKEDLPF